MLCAMLHRFFTSLLSTSGPMRSKNSFYQGTVYNGVKMKSAFFKGTLLVVCAVATLQVHASEPEHETQAQGLGRSRSEIEARTDALDQCRKNLTLAKNACTAKKGSFREVVCGVSCVDLTTLWECKANGSGFCHGHQEPL